jgi:hypothetical protein
MHLFRTMNKLLFLLTGLVISFCLQAQLPNTTCVNAIQICFDDPVGYPATINAGAAETGPNYGCLNSRPNPAWFYFQVSAPGDHQLFITNTQARDLDFIIYGPFSTEDDWCDSLTALNTADCSYAGGTTETANFTSTAIGDVYVLLITNFSNQPTNVSVVQNAGNGAFDCNFVAPCIVSQVLSTPGTCDTLSNSYQLSGQVWSFNTPQTGTLTVSVDGQSQQFNAPFVNPVPFSFSGLPSTGASTPVTAVFSASATCTGTGTYTAPASCIPCQASVSSNSPVCQGDTIEIITNFDGTATFQWVGPDFFTSTQKNPSLLADSEAASGEYTVIITGANCISERSLTVDVIQSPPAQAIPLETELCEGEIVFLSAVDFPGAMFQWDGPNGFTAGTRNTQVNNATSAASGEYIVSFSVNGCIGTPDTIAIQVFDAPQITLNLPPFVNPQTGQSTFYIEGAEGLSYQWNFIGNTTLISDIAYSAQNDTAYISWDGGEGIVGAQVIATDSNGCISEPVQALSQVVIPLEIAHLIDNVPSVFPNPADAFTRLHNFSSGKYILYDLAGKQVDAGVVQGENITLNRNGINAGVYWLELSNEVGSTRIKLVWR